MLKLSVYPGELALSVGILVTRPSLLVLNYDERCGGVEPWHHHYCLYTTSTPGLRSLDLGVACRIVGPVDGLRTQALSQWVMSAPQSDGLVCHECVVGRGAHKSSVGGGPVLYCGSIPDVVNRVSHLWWVSLPSSALLSSSASPVPRLGASGFIQGRALIG